MTLSIEEIAWKQNLLDAKHINQSLMTPAWKQA